MESSLGVGNVHRQRRRHQQQSQCRKCKQQLVPLPPRLPALAALLALLALLRPAADAFNLQLSSLEDLVLINSRHLSFVGSFQSVFPESEDCTDACIYTAHRSDTQCAVHERFFPEQISVTPPVWVWESSEIPAGEYNAMLATDEKCWEAVGTLSDLGVMEPVPFTVPSYGSTVRLTYYEDAGRVTAHVIPLVQQFSCDGKPYFMPDWTNYGGPFEEDGQVWKADPTSGGKGGSASAMSDVHGVLHACLLWQLVVDGAATVHG